MQFKGLKLLKKKGVLFQEDFTYLVSLDHH